MPDFWGVQTDYDRNAGKRAEEAKAAAQASIDNTNRTVLNPYMQNPSGQFVQYGTPDQIAHEATNLSQVGTMTGQNIFQTGAQQQEYLQSLEARRNGGDAVAANMTSQRNRNMANMSRQMAGKKVAGGVAAAGLNSAENMADSDINSQKQKNAVTNDNALWNYVKRNQKVTGEALAMGGDQGLADQIDTSAGTGVFGTVICSELYRQGIMDHDTYLKDVTFGMALEKKDPHAVYGYRMMATPVVKLMKKSKFFTRLIAVPALAWADNMAGKENFAGKAIMLTGIPFSRFVYRLVTGYYFCPEAREYV